MSKRLYLYSTCVAVGLIAAWSTLAPAAGAQTRGDRFFDRMDANGDGLITQTELAEGRARRFERMDANGDGVISEDEIAKIRERVQRRMQRRADAMSKIDANGDGQITRDEIDNQPFRALRFDADGDGALSRSEFDAAAEARRKQP
ncbi:MAG: EF-hand domain-containing protein [Pseudomonadota bacterium]